MNEQSIAIFSYEHRTYEFFDPRKEFRRLCLLHELQVKEIPLSKHHNDFNCDEIEIWEVTMIDNDHHHIPDIDQYLHIIERNDNEYIISIHNQLIKIQQGSSDSWMNELWVSSIVLSRFILKNDITSYHNYIKDDTRKPLCLELGAGCLGLLSMAALIKNMDVIATDKENLTKILEINLKNFINTNNFDITSSYRVEVLDWTAFSENNIDNNQKNEIKQRILGNRVPDFIICSDCLYSTAAVKPLLETINYLSGKNTVLIIANELRTALDEFILIARHDNVNPRTFKDIELSKEDSDIYTSNDSGIDRYANRPVRLLIC